MATRVYNRLSQSMQRGSVIERGDLVNSANVAILTRYQAARAKESPFGYLFQVARIQMIHFVNGRTGNIVNTRNSGPITVLSLDVLAEDEQMLADELVCTSSSPGNAEHPSFARLLRAVESLPERERTVIQYYHGFGQAPQSLNRISKLFSASPRTDQFCHACYDYSQRERACWLALERKRYQWLVRRWKERERLKQVRASR